MKNNQNEGLKRELGVLDVAVNVINISIASGIFLLPALIAGILGNASIVAYVMSIPIITLIILAWFIFQSSLNEVLSMGIFVSVLSIIYVSKLFFAKRALQKQ